MKNQDIIDNVDKEFKTITQEFENLIEDKNDNINDYVNISLKIDDLIVEIDNIDTSKMQNETKDYFQNVINKLKENKEIVNKNIEYIDKRAKNMNALISDIRITYEHIKELSVQEEFNDLIIKKIVYIREIIEKLFKEYKNINRVEFENILKDIDMIEKKYKKNRGEYDKVIEEINIKRKKEKLKTINPDQKTEILKQDTGSIVTGYKKVILEDNDSSTDTTTNKKGIPFKDWIIIILFSIAVIIAIVFQAITWAYVAILWITLPFAIWNEVRIRNFSAKRFIRNVAIGPFFIVPFLRNK